MIISRTPFRVSFFGGGTDYPAWLEQDKGAVLATTIDKYCYISCRWLPPFFPHRHRIVYSQIETVRSIDEISHNAVRETLRFLEIDDGVEIHHDGDLPARTGLGSSSSFTVGLLNALYALKGEIVSKARLAAEAIHIEQDLIGENVGSQDQTVTAHGGLARIDFQKGAQAVVHQLPLASERRDELVSHLMMFFTGFARTASQIAAEQVRNIPALGRELRAMYGMVDEAVEILAGGGDLREFGRLLHEGWKLKRGLSTRVTNDGIDEMYETALGAGAIGGKLLGAGGGGFFLLMVEPDLQERVTSALAGFLRVPFKFDDLGTQIVVYQPEDHVR
ncbi:MAG: kinase [Myxococcota bacterium]